MVKLQGFKVGADTFPVGTGDESLGWAWAELGKYMYMYNPLLLNSKI